MSESMVVLKLDFEGQIKRIRAMPKSYAELQQLITDSFPAVGLERKIHYQDVEGDTIDVTCDADLQEAYLQLKEAKGSTMKFCVTVLRPSKPKKPRPKVPVLPPPNPPTKARAKLAEIRKAKKDKKAARDALAELVKKVAKEELAQRQEEIKDRTAKELETSSMLVQQATVSPAVHETVTCDGCDVHPIVGVRYKCLQCSNYDLCATCEANGIHSHHIFTKVNTPDQASVAREANLGNAVMVDVPMNLLPSLKGAPVGQILETLAKAHRGQVQGEEAKAVTKPEKAKKRQRVRMAQVFGGKEKRIVAMTSAPDFIFNVQWTLENNSKKPWPQSVYIAKSEGNIAFETVPYPAQLQPGEVTTLELPIKAPSQPGNYNLKLSLIDETAQPFGQLLVVRLKVAAAGDNEEELAYQAAKLQADGFGTFDECYDALQAAQGNVEAAQQALKRT